MDQDKKFMREALKEAKKALLLDEVPIGCVIVKDNKIIARGHNLKETKKQATKHAEIVAIEKASKKLMSWRLLNCTLYVTLEPCPMCAGAIFLSRIMRVVYAASDQKGGVLNETFSLYEQPFVNHRPLVDGGILKSEAEEILKTYFKNKRNR